MLYFFLAMLDNPEDEQIFEEMYHRYREQMMRYAMRILGNHHDAEDAVQEAFCALARNMDHWAGRPEQTVKGYVYKVIHSTSIDAYRKKRREEVPLSMEEIPEFLSEIDVPKEYASNETYLRMLNILRKLPISYRAVLSLYWVENCSPKQIADLLNRPIETVRSQLKRGNALLKNQLRKEHIYDDSTRKTVPATSVANTGSNGSETV